MAAASAESRPVPGPMVDLSHEFPPTSKWSPTAPDPTVRSWMSHEESETNGHYDGCTCEITEVSFVTSLGTYLDSPFHFHKEGKDVSQLSLEQLVLPGVVIDVRDVAKAGETIPASVLDGVDLAGRAVLFRSDWSEHWGSEEYYEHPFLGKPIVDALSAGKPKFVGVDWLVVDDMHDKTRPCHHGLLGQEILISENLTNLKSLAEHPRAVRESEEDARAVHGSFLYFAVPVKMKSAAAFPNRSFAMFT